MAPATRPRIADNASTAFSTSANLFNHLIKTLSSFDGGPPSPPPPNTPVMAKSGL